MLRNLYFALWAIVGFCISCTDSNEFDSLQQSCTGDLQANTTFNEVKTLYKGELLQIQSDLIIEGYVISSDRSGNFFNVLHFQDRPSDPTSGFQIEIDLRQSYLLFELGSKVLIKLKGLYLGQSKGVFKLGGTFAGFGTVSVGRLPALQIPEHIFLACGESEAIVPTEINIERLSPELMNTLVHMENVEIIDEEIGYTFAMEREETQRTLTDCFDNKITMLNSGFSDFQQELLPEGNGSVTGVLLKENDDYFLAIRDLNDIDFSRERCEEIITEFTSNSVFISELADPNNNAGARFVELYNSDPEPLSLNGWTLRRYTNGNIEVSSEIDLSGNIIEGQGALVISPNAEEFQLVYGFVPDLGVGTNSPADSNGDDNLELVDPFGEVIDVFGMIGEDGSGTDHEFEDGRAVRNSNIIRGNKNYTFSEWMIFNDSGNAGTIDQPQNAPEDFTPRNRD